MRPLSQKHVGLVGMSLIADSALLGEHPRPADSEEVLGPEVSPHGGGLLPRGHHQLPAGHPGRQVLPANQVAVHDTGRSTGHQE